MNELMNRKINNGREYRTLSMDAVEGDDYIVEGYATTFNQPYYLYRVDENTTVYEQVDGKAFDNADLSDVIFQYDHEGKVYARLSNDTMKLYVNEHGLKVRAYLGGTSNGRNLYEEIKGGYTNKMSFGFTVADDNMKPSANGYIRTITKIGKLFDVSAVSYPQNDYTEISARKHCDGVIAELESERLLAEVREHQKAELLERLRGLKDGN